MKCINCIFRYHHSSRNRWWQKKGCVHWTRLPHLRGLGGHGRQPYHPFFFFFEERLIPKLEPANNCFWWKVLDIALRPERGLVFTLQYQPLKKTIQSSIILLIRGDCLHNALTFLTKSLPILLFTLSKSLKNRAVEGMVDMLALSKKLNMRRSNKEI